MKMRKYMITALAGFLAAGLLTGCGAASSGTNTDTEHSSSASEANNGEEGQTEAPADSGEGEEPLSPEEYTVKDLYQATDCDMLYRVKQLDTEGYTIDSGYVKDGYIFLCMREKSDSSEPMTEEEEWYSMGSKGKLVLFPMGHPEEMTSLAIEGYDDNYLLLNKGQLLSYNYEQGYKIYDSRFSLLYEEDGGCGIFQGASADNDVWFYTEDKHLEVHRDGKLLQSVELPEGISGYEYIGDSEGEAWFKLLDENFNTIEAAIDLTDWTYQPKGSFFAEAYAKDGMLSYGSEDGWYLSSLRDPLSLTCFAKSNSNENTWRLDEKFLIGDLGSYDDDFSTYYDDLHVYDLSTGSLCAEISNKVFPDTTLYYLDYSEDTVLIWESDDLSYCSGVYLWDLSDCRGEAAEPSYKTVDYHMDQDRIDKIMQDIRDTYDVEIYYDQEHLTEAGGSYDLIEPKDMELLGYTLLRLQECMQEYPDNFFRELKGNNFTGLIFYLSDTHIKNTEYMADNVAATASTNGSNLVMTVDVNYWWQLRRTFLHENMHLMENRIDEETWKDTMSNIEYWCLYINSQEYPSMHAYNWERNEENLKGVYGVGEETEWYYVDDYSKSTPAEDRARILENQIYTGSSYYFEAEHLKEKARFLNALIREHFPCVKNSQEEVLWEHMTGIVDLNTEFADYVSMK